MSNFSDAARIAEDERLEDLGRAIERIRVAQAYLTLAEPALKAMPTVCAELRAIQALIEDLVGARIVA